MKTLILLITFSLLLYITGLSQKKGEIDPSLIKEMRIIPSKITSSKLKKTNVIEAGGSFKFGIELTLKDGSIRKTKRIGDLWWLL